MLLACTWLQPVGPPKGQRCVVDASDGCFLEIKGGSFLRGAQSTDPNGPGYDPDAREDEGPVTRVEVSTFWLQEEEVTFSAWNRCDACNREGARRGMGDLHTKVVGVTREDAAKLCATFGGRLPTETEWEYAARSDESRRYPWGDAPPCGQGSPHDPTVGLPVEMWSRIPGCKDLKDPVSPRSRSPFKVRDMAWGAAEWTQSAYTAGGYDDAEHATLGVVRGASFAASDAAELRAASRQALPPTARLPDVGVRCAF